MNDAYLAIDTTDPTPPYEQLRRQIIGHIRRGALSEADRLPPVRQLARDLGLAPGTVARAYKQLEGEGYVTTRRGAGTRVAHRDVAPPGNPPRGKAPSGEWADERLARAARDYAATAAVSGHSLTDAIEALAQAWGTPAGRRARHDDERQQ
ncbi:GntR family transcriptional regulator [Lolliginicoccus suaedae]|uniref:GntR family transcriptional regulator n=1 Tax=Lolliginicoccus suaedae TaxID=2605429 RepID=UPI0011ECA935|nr:GntR family transcriptional regulator [Lolliginicoccus suaedae]